MVIKVKNILSYQVVVFVVVCSSVLVYEIVGVVRVQDYFHVVYICKVSSYYLYNINMPVL